MAYISAFSGTASCTNYNLHASLKKSEMKRVERVQIERPPSEEHEGHKLKTFWRKMRRISLRLNAKDGGKTTRGTLTAFLNAPKMFQVDYLVIYCPTNVFSRIERQSFF